MLFRRWLVVFVFSIFSFQVHAITNQADSNSVEWIKVYFNMPTDYSKALPGNMSRSSQDLIGMLETHIESAEHSIDLAIYDLEHPRIGQALTVAKERGVRVRIVTDNYNRMDFERVDSTMWAMLRRAGITSIDDDGDIYHMEMWKYPGKIAQKISRADVLDNVSEPSEAFPININNVDKALLDYYQVLDLLMPGV